MQSTAHAFKENAHKALGDAHLQEAVGNHRQGFTQRRARARDKLPEFEQLRDAARDIKNHALAHLDLYLERYEQKVLEQGGQVHWCPTAEDARQAILDICRSVDAKMVTKGKSMVAEEIGLNDYLEANGVIPAETDLGEYIIQLRHEPPSHIIAPAVHLTKAQVEADFRANHTELPAERSLAEPESLVREARTMLRQKYLDADVARASARCVFRCRR